MAQSSDDLLRKVYTEEEYREKIEFYREMGKVCRGYEEQFHDTAYGEHAGNMDWIAKEMEKKLGVFQPEEEQ